MKKHILLLLAALALCLSGCTPRQGSLPSADPSPTVTPAPTVRPTAVPTAAPTGDPAPTATGAVVTTHAPTGLTADALWDLALTWCETHLTQLAGYDALRIDGGYWFADHVEHVGTVAFHMADGTAGDIWFAQDDTGAGPEAMASLLLGTEELSLLDWDGVKALAAEQLSALAGEGLREPEALSAFLALAETLPALGEDMYYCTAGGVGYVLMVREDLFRLQRLDALLAYADSPAFRIRMDYDKAVEAYSWFRIREMDTLSTDSREVEGSPYVYYRVDYPGIETLADLRLYLKDVFSDEIVDELLPTGQDQYLDIGGALYCYPMDRTAAETREAHTVVSVSDTRLLYRVEAARWEGEPPALGEPVTYQFPYEKLGSDWLFTEFALVNEV